MASAVVEIGEERQQAEDDERERPDCSKREYPEAKCSGTVPTYRSDCTGAIGVLRLESRRKPVSEESSPVRHLKGRF
jgi:hypothetical protein